MKPLSRRSVIAGSAAVVTALPAVGLCKGAAVAASDDTETRIKYHTRELERAMYERYGRAVEILRFEPLDGMVASILLAANGRAIARPAARSKWLYVGE